ncbi:hypothetical protein [Nannocystis punicea]|uniref:NADH-quinone oxidoreductase subunit D domain-containing protein n=1 Tax=Nannocystis punicea TaxID=2995304 RepID=A0ABY7H5K2_9BACT|nr:hypothetical protein [Nannocystis poenicansa]WAS94294.1 hypothetical protein O0S08_49870 [Nannocystis poenicansa]
MTVPRFAAPPEPEDPGGRSFLRLVSSRSVPAAPGDDDGGPGPLLVAALDDLPELPGETFVAALARETAAGARVLVYHGRRDDHRGVVLTAALVRPRGLAVMRGRAGHQRPLPALRGPLGAHENLLERTYGLQLAASSPRRAEDQLDPRDMWFWPAGKDQSPSDRDVGFGGLVDHGPLRLHCRGDQIRAVEVRALAGRDVEAVLCTRPLVQLPALVETLRGEGSIARAWAHAMAVEGLAGVTLDLACSVHRGVGLELERIAGHLVGLAAVARAIGFGAGAAELDRLQATIRDLLMRLCGSRHGHAHVRPGGVREPFGAARLADVRATLNGFRDAFARASAMMMGARSVQARLDGVGFLGGRDAAQLGLVGPAARASGLPHDLRRDLPGRLYRRHAVDVFVEYDGDCLARASLRVRETEAAVAWILGCVAEAAGAPPILVPSLAPRHLAIAAVEGARGPIVHLLETDAAGRLLDYRAQDPAMFAWEALAAAVRGGSLADVPLCGHSLDLSLLHGGAAC